MPLAYSFDLVDVTLFLKVDIGSVSRLHKYRYCIPVLCFLHSLKNKMSAYL